MGLLQASEHTAFQQLVREVFPNYANHYSANPMLDQALCLEGYVEWASSLLNNDTSHVFVSRTSTGQLASFIAIQGEGNTAEIALNGTAPSSQGSGVYSDLLTFACAELGAMGFIEINTSTQSSAIVEASFIVGIIKRIFFIILFMLVKHLECIFN